MQHDFSLASLARATVLAGIEHAVDDPSEMKFRIMLARQCGHITDEQTRDMIIANRLESA